MENFSGSLSVQENAADLVNLIFRYLGFTKSLSKDHRWGDHLNDVSQRGGSSDGGQMSESWLLDLNVFGGASDSYDLNDFVERVRKKSDDQQSVEQIDWDSVRGFHLSTSNFTNSSVGG